MTLQIYYDEIESLLYQANLSVVCGMSVLLSALETADVVQAMIRELDNRDSLRALRGRIGFLCGRATDEGRVDYDESIVTYLYALSQIDPALAREASCQIMNARGLFWSRRMALRILEATEAKALPAIE